MSAASVWIDTPNPFHVARPSDWWLQLLWDYDDQLRVFASQVEPTYRLARLVRREARLGLSAMVVHEHPDTVIMIQHGCVPVSTLTPWAVQSDKVIRDLMARDLWRQGGAGAAVTRIEQAERDAERRQDAVRRDTLDAVNGDAYRSLKQRKGERVVLSDTNRGRQKTGSVNPLTIHLARGADNIVSSPGHRAGKPERRAPFGGITLTDAT